MTKSVVFVWTSSSTFKGHLTGIWLEELATPYYMFKEAGYSIVIASIAGGPIPIDSRSMGGDFFTQVSMRFMHDAEAVNALCHSVPIAEAPTKYADAIYVPGGHGCCSPDFYNDPNLISWIEEFIAAGKIVALDCHGPTVLAQCKFDNNPIVSGIKVCGFTNSEEDTVGFTHTVDFLIETKFEEQGAEFLKQDNWNVCAVASKIGDGTLITG